MLVIRNAAHNGQSTCTPEGQGAGAQALEPRGPQHLLTRTRGSADHALLCKPRPENKTFGGEGKGPRGEEPTLPLTLERTVQPAFSPWGWSARRSPEPSLLVNLRDLP